MLPSLREILMIFRGPVRYFGVCWILLSDIWGYGLHSSAETPHPRQKCGEYLPHLLSTYVSAFYMKNKYFCRVVFLFPIPHLCSSRVATGSGIWKCSGNVLEFAWFLSGSGSNMFFWVWFLNFLFLYFYIFKISFL